MSPMEWIALGSLGILLCANLVGGAVGIVKLTNCLNDRFAELKQANITALDEHDKKDEQRQIEIVQRLTALETLSRVASRARRIQHAG